MPRGLWPAVALLALGGCYVPPQTTDYGSQPAYPTAGYPPPQYPPGVYPPAPYDPNAAYPGYDYSGGAPTIIEEGAPVPLVLLGGEWGYYDRERHWRRAPDDVRRRFEEHRDGRFEERRDAGPQFRPDRGRFGEGYGQPRPEGRPAPFGERPGASPGGFPGFRPNEQARPMMPAAAPARPTPLAAPASVFPGFRPSAPPPQESHDRRQNCPPGQRC